MSRTRKGLAEGESGASAPGSLVAPRPVTRPEDGQSFGRLLTELTNARDAYFAGDLERTAEHLAQLRAELDGLQRSLERDSGRIRARLRRRGDDAAALLRQGDAQRLAGQLDDSLETLRRAVERNPRMSKAFASLAATLGALGRTDDGLDAADRAVSLEPEDPFAHAVKGLLATNSGEVDAGLAELRKAVELDPDDAGHHAVLGETLASVGRRDEGIRELDRALELNPLDVPSLVSKARALNGLDRFEEAEYVLHEALRLEPDYVPALSALGTALANLRRFEEASAVLDRALAADDDAEALAVRGQIFAHFDDHEAAVTRLERALMLDAELPWAHAALGASLARTGQVERALASLDEAERLDPNDARPLVTRAELLGNLGRLDEALEVADRAQQLSPADANAFAVKGSLLVAQARELWSTGQGPEGDRRNEQATVVLEHAIALSAPDELAWARADLGAALLRAGRVEEALARLDDALHLEKDEGTRAWILANKGAALFALHRDGRALEALDEALPNAADAVFVLGKKAEIYADMAEWQRALELLDEASGRGAADAWVYGLRGWCLANVGDRAAESKAAYEQAFELDPDHWHLKGIANAELALGAEDAAAEKFRRIIDEREQSADVDPASLTLIGWCHYRLGKYEEAMHALADALALDATLIYAHFDLGLAMMCAGRHALSLDEYARGVANARSAMPSCARCGTLQVARRDLANATATIPSLEASDEFRQSLRLIDEALFEARRDCPVLAGA